jgi:hypothetical protein
MCMVAYVLGPFALGDYKTNLLTDTPGHDLLSVCILNIISGNTVQINK